MSGHIRWDFYLNSVHPHQSAFAQILIPKVWHMAPHQHATEPPLVSSARGENKRLIQLNGYAPMGQNQGRAETTRLCVSIQVMIFSNFLKSILPKQKSDMKFYSYSIEWTFSIDLYKSHFVFHCESVISNFCPQSFDQWPSRHLFTCPFPRLDPSFRRSWGATNICNESTLPETNISPENRPSQ